MIARSTATSFQSAPQNLQNVLTSASAATEQLPVAAPMISQTAIEEFALRFNAAMIEMLTAQGVSNASPLSKKLRAYATAGVAPVRATSRFA